MLLRDGEYPDKNVEIAFVPSVEKVAAAYHSMYDPTTRLCITT